MGAQTFTTTAKGKTAKEAFAAAIQAARNYHGNRPYTGSIAEKHDFIMIDLPKGKKAQEFAKDLIYDGDYRIDDKWGPAGCIKSGKDEYLFFGWASS